MGSDDWLTTIEDLQEVTRTGFWEWEPATQAVRWSGELFRLFGEDPETYEPDYQKYLDHLHPEDRRTADEGLRAAAETGSPYEHDERVIRPGGTMRWMRCKGTAIERDGRRILFGTAQDITERTLMQKRIERYERMEAIARTAGGLAHDLANLVSVVTLSADRLTTLDLPEEAASLLEGLSDAADRALGLSRRLMTVGRRAPGTPAGLELSSLLEELKETLRAALGESIELRVKVEDEGALTLEADPEHVQRVLLNLCANARDATGDSGVVTIEAKLSELDAKQLLGIEGAEPGTYVLLAVEDDGEGIDPALIDHIFEPFVTTKGEHGTGLGLATVEGLVSTAGGFVQVQSRSGEGSRFEVYWPRRAE